MPITVIIPSAIKSIPIKMCDAYSKNFNIFLIVRSSVSGVLSFLSTTFIIFMMIKIAAAVRNPSKELKLNSPVMA